MAGLSGRDGLLFWPKLAARLRRTGPFIGHSGGLPGFGSNWRIMPDYGIGIVSFANRTYAPMAVVNLRVLDTLIRIAGLQPRHLPPSIILEQRKKELV